LRVGSSLVYRGNDLLNLIKDAERVLEPSMDSSRINPVDDTQLSDKSKPLKKWAVDDRHL